MRKKNKPGGSFLTIRGKLVPGYRVASGPSQDYPYGSLSKQKPLFKALGLDLDQYYEGTLNISIVPYHYAWVKPQYTFRGVEWTDLHPPEDFSFHPCRIKSAGQTFEGMIYYPHPETKIRNFEEDTIIEVMTIWIPNLHPGDILEIEVEEGALSLAKTSSKSASKA